MSTKLQGALRWSAAEEAAARISAVRDAVENANGAADGQRQLKHGLTELDSIRTFLQEGINTCNQQFVENGNSDGVLHSALEKGLTELEDVRRKVVHSLSKTSTTRGADSTSAGNGGGATTTHLRRQRPPSAPTSRAKRDLGMSSKTGVGRVGISGERLNINNPTLNQGRQTLQRSNSAKSRPMSATTRPSSATRRAFEGNSRAYTTTSAQPDENAGVPKKAWSGASAPQGESSSIPATKPVAPGRTRPMSAPNRHRSGSAPVQPTADQKQDDGQGESTTSSAWGKYQDWAQSVLNRVQNRRVQQHRQTMQKPQKESEEKPATGAAASGKAPLAQGPVLRRAQTASINRMSSATSGSSGLPQRPQSASVKLNAQAQALREQGNIHFQQKRYRESAECYSRALDVEPNSETLFCNRAAAYLMMNKFAEALSDSRRAIDLDPTHVKAHWRSAKAYLYLGNSEEAKNMYMAAHKLAEGADCDSIATELKTVDLIEKCRRCLRLREWQEALRCAEGILEVFPASGPCSTPWMCLKAEATLNIDPSEASTMLTAMCAEDPSYPETWVLRAKALFYTGHDAVSTNSCLTYLQKARELDPKNSRIETLEGCITSFSKLRDDGNSAYAAGRWQDAYLAYTKCLSVDPYNNSLKAIILCNRAAVCIQCERWRDALDDINQSIGFNPHNAKAYTRRARIHQHNLSHDAAVKDLQLAVQMYPSSENQERLTQAVELKNHAAKQQRQQQQQQQQSGSNGFRYFNFAGGGSGSSGQSQQQRPYTAGARRPQSAQQRHQQQQQQNPEVRQKTHYDTLGLNRNCEERAIIKAYRDAALKWHPDKWASAPENQKAIAEATFKNVSVAYNTLKDAAKRRQYDLSLAF